MENENVNQGQQNQSQQDQNHEQENQQGQEQETGGRTYTQAEVDALIGKRLARERKGQPDADELAKFREWQKTQKTPEEKAKDSEAELEAARREVENTRRENFLLKQGVDPEDVEYYAYKISKTLKENEDFEDAAKAFLKEHNGSSRSGGSKPRFDTGGRLSGNGGKKTASEQFNDLIRAARNK